MTTGIKVKAIMKKVFLFGSKLRMEREITSVSGQNIILLTDIITNFGSKPSPYTILYHMTLDIRCYLKTQN